MPTNTRYSSSSHRHRHRHHHKRKIWPWVVGILAIIVAFFVACGICGAILMKQANEVKQHEANALSALGGNTADISQAVTQMQTKLPQIQEETRAATQITQGTLWNIAAKAPFIGNDIATVQGMTSVLDSIMHDSVPQLVDAVDTLQQANLHGTDGSLNVQPIVQVQPTVSAANESLQRQVAIYNSLQTPTISTIAKPYEQGKEQLDTMAQHIDEISNAFAILPVFLGTNGQTNTYAVMAMTTSELRSSGGLIGSVGEMTTHDGDIQIGDFRANTEYLDYGVSDYTDDEKRVFIDEGPFHMSLDLRDIASYPDAERTAENMKAIWDRTPWGKEQPLSGVLEVDPVFLQELIAINGNVTLPDGTVLTGDNTAKFLLNEVYSKYPEEQQDALFGTVASESISAMFHGADMTKLMKTAQALGQMAKERHFSIYSFDTEVEQVLQQAGFTAQTPSSEENPAIGVYLSEQNPSKMGWYLKRSTKIKTVSCDDDGARVYHVEYTLENTLKEDEVASLPKYITGITGEMPGVSYEKVLIYPPEGGSISNAVMLNGEANAVQKNSMNGKTMYEAIATVKPGQRVTYSFDVTTSAKATAPLAVDQTPMGWMGDGVTYEGASCAPRG